MISYCHADKELVYRIEKFLADQGFKIWIYHDRIYGPGNLNFTHIIVKILHILAMQAMAEAVEKSEFVILCM
jgi:hypothetical protein